jgi:hypothetical protein
LSIGRAFFRGEFINRVGAAGGTVSPLEKNFVVSLAGGAAKSGIFLEMMWMAMPDPIASAINPNNVSVFFRGMILTVWFPFFRIIAAKDRPRSRWKQLAGAKSGQVVNNNGIEGLHRIGGIRHGLTNQKTAGAIKCFIPGC